MKNITKIIALAMALMLTLSIFTACGKKTEPAATDDTVADTAAAPADDTASAADDTETAEGDAEVHPYAWMGLEDMPRCNYLDIISANHYIQVCDSYAMSIVAEQTEAVDGINTYTATSNSRQYSIDGHVYSLNGNTKTYVEYDMSSVVESARKNQEDAIASGTNINGRKFQSTGKGVIPLYSDKTGDTAEYEYYEYLNDSSTDTVISKVTERYYMKDGDVFAIYTNSEVSTIKLDSLKVIKSISADIPEGLIATPDLTGYEKYE